VTATWKETQLTLEHKYPPIHCVDDFEMRGNSIQGFFDVKRDGNFSSDQRLVGFKEV